MISFSCSCGKTFSVEDVMAGKTAKCPNCGERVTVPAQTKKKKKTKFNGSGLQILGGVLLAFGIFITVRFLTMNTVIDNVHNLGLMHSRQTGVQIGLVISTNGFLAMIAGGVIARINKL